MKFIISRNELCDLIAHIHNIVMLKVSIPILSNFLIEAAGNEITMTATDLTVGVRCRTEAKVVEEGSTTLPAKRFFQLIRELTGSHIEFSCTSDDISEIVVGTSKFTFNGMSKEEFPTLPDFTGAPCMNIKSDLLKESLLRTSFSVAKDDHRQILTGVYMNIANSALTLIGTDGKRLATTTSSISHNDDVIGNYVLPLKAVDEIVKISDIDDVTLYFFNDKIAIDTNKITVISKLLSGEYPDVKRVIPETTDTNVTLHRDELISLLKQITIFTPDSEHSVCFTLSDGDLKLTANNAQVGNAKVNMPVNYSGTSFDIAFNPGFFLDVLRHSKDETVTLGITDSYNPGIITDSSNTTCVLMPMRLHKKTSEPHAAAVDIH